MEDNRYLEQAAALLDKAKEAGEAIGVVLVTSGRKNALNVNGSGVAILNTLLNLNRKENGFCDTLAVAVAAMMLKDGDFAHKIDVLRAHPAELLKHLEECSKKLDAEFEAAWKPSEDSGDGDETENEESHDSEEAA